jgi:glycosyltransferase involved in cell wall biosynthesis
MAYAEAIAHGLPVVATRAGAIPDTVGSGALMVDVGDVSGLTLALRSLLSDPGLRARFVGRSREAAARLPTWESAADLFARAVVSADGPKGAAP